MLEALKCPACSASLEPPKDGSPLLRCPYCNSAIADRSAPSPSPTIGIDLGFPGPTRGLKFGLIFLVLIVIAIPVSIIAIVRSATRGIQTTITKVTPPIIVRVPATTPISRPTLASKPAPPPPFARMMLEFGVEGVGPGRFQDAQSIAVDNLGHVYVGEVSGEGAAGNIGARVQVFDLQGKYLAGWTTGVTKRLRALAADRKGTVYACVSPQILRFEGLTGKPLGAMDDMNVEVEEFYRDVYVTVDGDVYAIGGNSHIIQFDAEGKIKRTIKANDKVGEAVGLERILVQPTGEIYAFDPQRGMIKFAADGRYINRFGAGRGSANLLGASYFATDGKGRLYVSGAAPGIRVYDPEGNYIDAFGQDSAYGLAISDNNEIHATFAGKHVVRKFVLDK